MLAAPSRLSAAALKLSLGQHAEAGRKPVQQDCHGARIPPQPLLASKGAVLALADGIGSSSVSQDASRAAVRAVLEDYYGTSEAWSVKRSMQRVLAATNSWLHAQTQRSPYRHDHDRGYVCAMAVLVLKGRAAHCFHAGDVRIARLQDGVLEPLTEDHRVYIGGGQSYLSRALGFQSRLDVDYRCLALEPGDIYLLASDGVHEHLLPADLRAALDAHPDDLDACARQLVQAAFERGSPDNLSLQLVRVEALPTADLIEAQQARANLPFPGLLAPRSELDGFRIERELAGSHRSHVYLATEVATSRLAVLKTPSVDLAQDEAALDRLMLEEWIARRIQSPHVLRPFDAVRPRTQLYSATEYVEGQTLAQWMRDNPRPELEAVRDMVEQIARGLQAFHRLEMLHQDLRPENLMIDRSGTVRIIDFGSVQVAGLNDAAGPDAAPQVLGTLQYTAPECLLGEPATERSDLFALGVLAYQMLSGRLPYGTQAASVRTVQDVQRLRYLSVLDEGRAIPAWIDAVLERAVHPTPAKRHEALSEFAFALRQPGAEALAVRPRPLAQRHPVRFWQAVSLVLALIVLLQFMWLQGRSAANSSHVTSSHSP
ncbi:bifunctional protein-serine/threonine kinase/phosphatase [Roseateles paludis]|jgi:serine/threonine protein phosphatase PrpC/predicted Ser/Thr protein kinase|uniref:Bifunctional protein-serine/threonine kinase/phosphatase n=1 Tax=Roseateles paludis TaxID=3145238 RepID=A0ABV0G242_9BURK